MDSNVTFLQLKKHEHIDYDDLVRISELIYDTDPYIYPCIFNRREDALRILPTVLQQGEDNMFSLDNLFVAQCNGKIVGMILWYKGPLDWNTQSLFKYATYLDIKLSPSLPLAQTQYFDSYKTAALDTISLINICINKCFRNRGVCNQLLKAFIAEHAKEKMELFVLSDNCPAKKVYTAVGFRTIRTFQGFVSDNHYLPCDQMILN